MSQLDSVPCHLDKLDLEATASPERTLEQYKVGCKQEESALVWLACWDLRDSQLQVVRA